MHFCGPFDRADVIDACGSSRLNRSRFELKGRFKGEEVPKTFSQPHLSPVRIRGMKVHQLDRVRPKLRECDATLILSSMCEQTASPDDSHLFYFFLTVQNLLSLQHHDYNNIIKMKNL